MWEPWDDQNSCGTCWGEARAGGRSQAQERCLSRRKERQPVWGARSLSRVSSGPISPLPGQAMPVGAAELDGAGPHWPCVCAPLGEVAQGLDGLTGAVALEACLEEDIHPGCSSLAVLPAISAISTDGSMSTRGPACFSQGFAAPGHSRVPSRGEARSPTAEVLLFS